MELQFILFTELEFANVNGKLVHGQKKPKTFNLIFYYHLAYKQNTKVIKADLGLSGWGHCP